MPKGQAGPNALQPIGRPSAITPTRIGRVLRNVAIGNYFKTACQAAAIPPGTATNWRQNGEQELERIRPAHPDAEVEVMGWLEEHGTPENLETYDATAAWWGRIPPWITHDRWLHVVFSVLLTHARARAEAAHVRNIRTAAQQDWRASAWFLERTRPQEFGRIDRVEHTGAEGGPVQVEESITVDALEARINEIRAQRAADTEERTDA